MNPRNTSLRKVWEILNQFDNEDLCWYKGKDKNTWDATSDTNFLTIPVDNHIENPVITQLIIYTLLQHK
mgnify:CR=1 FL=1